MGTGTSARWPFPARPMPVWDPDARPLREALRRGAYRLLLQADGGRLPFPDAVFGTVGQQLRPGAYPGGEPVVREVARALRPGGRFYFSVPGPDFLALLSIGRALDRLGLRPLGNFYRAFFHRISRHYSYDGVEGWRARLERAGLHMLDARPYLSPRALAAMEWGHYFGLPSLVAKKLTGRWIIWPSRPNLWLTDRLFRPFYEDAPAAKHGCLFVTACKRGGADERAGE